MVRIFPVGIRLSNEETLGTRLITLLNSLRCLIRLLNCFSSGVLVGRRLGTCTPLRTIFYGVNKQYSNIVLEIKMDFIDILLILYATKENM